MPDKHVLLLDRSAASLNEKAYVALEEMIVSGALAPGSQWSEVTLSERIGIGRTPTREALQKLSHQRLVRIAPRQGIFISDIDYPGHLKVIQARREIEQLVVSQAAQCIGDKERQPMRLVARHLEEIKSTKDIATYLRLHFTLTLLLGEASRNPYAAEFFSMLQTLARRFMNLHEDGYNDFATLCDLHIRQIDAVVAGNAAVAVASANERNDYAERFARKVLMDLIDTSGVTVSRARR